MCECVWGRDETSTFLSVIGECVGVMMCEGLCVSVCGGGMRHLHSCL